MANLCSVGHNYHTSRVAVCVMLGRRKWHVLSLLSRHSVGFILPVKETPLPVLRAHTAVLCGDYFIHSFILYHSFYGGYEVVALYLDFS